MLSNRLKITTALSSDHKKLYLGKYVVVKKTSLLRFFPERKNCLTKEIMPIKLYDYSQNTVFLSGEKTILNQDK